jgi:hypothetical protein
MEHVVTSGRQAMPVSAKIRREEESVRPAFAQGFGAPSWIRAESNERSELLEA